MKYKIERIVMCQSRHDFWVRFVRKYEEWGTLFRSQDTVSWSSWRRLQRVLGDMVMQGRMTIEIELFDEGIITFERVNHEQEEV